MNTTKLSSTPITDMLSPALILAPEAAKYGQAVEHVMAHIKTGHQSAGAPPQLSTADAWVPCDRCCGRATSMFAMVGNGLSVVLCGHHTRSQLPELLDASVISESWIDPKEMWKHNTTPSKDSKPYGDQSEAKE